MAGTKASSKTAGRLKLTCAFCGGNGKDPFELLSKLANCQVCGGRGKVELAEPATECAFCGGTGIHRDQRLTCTVCGGRGMVTVQKGSKTCPDCGGKGVAAGDYLPCARCGGTGAVAAKGAAPKTARPRKKAKTGSKQ